MADRVMLRTNGIEIENFMTYEIDADMYQAEHRFMFTVINPGMQIRRAQLCEVFVNDKRELVGTIDRVHKVYGDQPTQYVIEGRDLMGILVDAYCEEFVTVQGMTCKTLAERLIRKLPHIQRKDIIYQENLKGKLKKGSKKGGKGGGSGAVLGKMDTAQALAQIQPGQKVFDVLKEFAASRGLLFHGMPDGTFVFGKPISSGPATFSFILRKSENTGENNILQGTSIDDISQRYSKITVVSQQQGQASDPVTGVAAMATGKINTSYVLTDPTFPRNFYKPYVAASQHDARGPKLHAQMILEKMRYDGEKLVYIVKGHSQNGENYRINVMARVEDEIGEIDGKTIDGKWVVYGRRMMQNEEGARTTEIRLGPPGELIE